MKKVLNLILTTAMTLSLAACSGNTPSGSDPTPPSGPSSGNGSTSNVPVSDDVGEHRWICGIDSPKDAVAFYYIEKMSQELDRLSNGNMTVLEAKERLRVLVSAHVRLTLCWRAWPVET